MKKIFAITLMAQFTGLVFAQSQSHPAAPLAITHVTVIDATGAPAKRDMTLVILGNRIAQLGPGKVVRAPEDALIIDATGKFVIPGLWDMHVHGVRRDSFDNLSPLFIANGVTSVRDMGAPLAELDEVRKLRGKIDDGTIPGPRIAAVAGPMLDGPKPAYPNMALPVTSAADAREKVRMLKQRGADFIKVYNALSRDSYFAILDEARRQRLPVTGHLPVLISAAEASDAGQRTMEHLGAIYFGVLLSCSTREAEIRRGILAATENPNAASQLAFVRAQVPIIVDSYSEEKARTLFQQFKAKQTWQVPTLTALRSAQYLDELVAAPDDRLKYISASVRARWNPQDFMPTRGRTADDFRNGRRHFQKQLEVVRAMNRADVPIMAGSDTAAGVPYVFAGFSLHEELALLHKAGLTPMKALQAATLNPARFLGMQKELGTIEMGKIADLVLLDANPLADIRNTQKIHAVVINGRMLERDSLDDFLAQAEAAAIRR